MPALALSRVGARVVESGPGGEDLAADTWQRLEALPDRARRRADLPAGLPDRGRGLRVHRRRDEASVVCFALGGEILPAGDAVTAAWGAALAVGGEVLDRVVAHGVVEGDLLACGDGLAGDEVVSAAGVEVDSGVDLHGVQPR